MNYNTMSVDEWLQAFFEAATEEGLAIVYDKEVTIDEIKRELRKAVIREASVGTKEIYDPSTGKWYVAELIPNPEKRPFA